MLDENIKQAMANCPDEAKIIRRTIRALKANGTPVTSVDTGEDIVTVTTEHEILNEVFSVDTSYLHTASNDWVMVILGNGVDVISDYSLGEIESVMDEVIAYADTLDVY